MLPLLIGSAVAVTLLIIIHFFGLRLRQKLDFSHLQFLTALIAKTRSVRKINNYLLLLVRFVFILSALGAFWLFFSKKPNEGVVISANVLVDNSWSMSSPSVEKTQSKTSLVKRDAEDIQKANITSGQSGRSTEKISTYGRNQLATPDFSSAEELLSQIGNQKRSSRTFILSDFQKSAFSESLLKELPKNHAITLVPYPSSKGTSNLYIDSVWLDVPILMPGKVADVSVRVGGSLVSEETQVKITASAQEQLIGATQVLLKPGQKAFAKFKVPIAKEAKQITFSIEDPTTTFDNQFFAVLPKPASIQVGLSREMGAKHPVVNAFKAEPGFILSGNVTAKADVWIVEVSENGTGLPEPASSKQWVEQGGTLILLPSSKNQKVTLRFLNALGLQGILEERGDAVTKVVKQPDLSDVFFKQIFEKEVKNMSMPEAKPVLTWRSAFHHILRFSDNTPFLSGFRLGKGKVYLFASPIKGSAFVNHPLFVPVFYQLALSSSSAHPALAHQPLNKVIEVPVPSGSKSKRPYILSKDGQDFTPNQKVIQDQLILTLPDELSQPGFYDLTRDGETLQQVAINIPKVESQLEAYTPEELEEIVAGHGGSIEVLARDEKVSWQKQVQNGSGGITLWKYCLILCFLCLLVEAVILSAKKRESLIQSGYDS